MVSSGNSSTSAGSEHRRLAACMRLVAVDSATSWQSASRMAAQASAPSWMKVLWAERTTTMLASSAATSRAPRMTSEVIWSSIVDVMESGARFVDGPVVPSVERVTGIEPA